MNLTHFPIIPSLNFGGKTVSQLEAKNFFEAKFFFQAEKFEAKIFFKPKNLRRKFFFKPKNLRRKFFFRPKFFSQAEKLTHVRKVTH